jgi:hypothetical protein
MTELYSLHKDKIRVLLYDAFGFTRSTPFRAVPRSLQLITIFMERKL